MLVRFPGKKIQEAGGAGWRERNRRSSFFRPSLKLPFLKLRDASGRRGFEQGIQHIPNKLLHRSRRSMSCKACVFHRALLEKEGWRSRDGDVGPVKAAAG